MLPKLFPYFVEMPLTSKGFRSEAIRIPDDADARTLLATVKESSLRNVTSWGLAHL